MGEIAHIRRRTQVYRQTVFQNQARIRRSREDHGRIVEAILAGDAVTAGQLMVEHISIGGRDLTDLISTVPQRLLATEVEAYPGKQTAESGRSPVAKPQLPARSPRVKVKANAAPTRSAKSA